jgi:hypothetical protein
LVYEPRNFGEDYANLIKSGSTRLETKFKTPLTELLNVIVLDIFPSALQIYHSGRVKCIKSSTITTGPTFTVKTVYTTSVISTLYIGVVSIDISTNGVVTLASGCSCKTDFVEARLLVALSREAHVDFLVSGSGTH